MKKELTEVTDCCDDCGKRAIYKCKACGKDLCEDCRHYGLRERNSASLVGVNICQACRQIVVPFQEKIWELEKEHENAVDALREEFMQAVRTHNAPKFR